jgi:hypothetical protein
MAASPAEAHSVDAGAPVPGPGDAGEILSA